MPSVLPLLFFLAVFSSPWVTAQQDTRPRNSLNAAFEKGNLMVALSEVEWRPGLTMAAARLNAGATISLNLTLRPATRYVFIASTANGDASDVDLYLRDGTGRILAEDQDADGTPILEFKTTEGGAHQIQLHLAGSDRVEEFVALSLLRGGGRIILREEYEKTTQNFFRLANVNRSNFEGTEWLSRPGQWCLLGYSVGKDQGITLRNIRPGEGHTYFAAAGSSTLSNIDLYLANRSLRIVEKDIGPGAKPILRHKTDLGMNYDLRIEVESNKGTGLLLVAIFQN